MKENLKWVLVGFIVCFVLAILVYLTSASHIWAVMVFCLTMTLVLVKPVLLILNRLVKKTNWYKSHLSDGLKFRKDISCELDLCNLGSNSGKYAFNYEETGMKCENWAVGPQTLTYDFKVLKNYFSYLKDGATVLIPVCPFSGCIKDFDNDAVNHKYYSFLHPRLILNFSNKTKEEVMRFVNTPFQHSPLISVKRLIRDIPYVDTEKSISDDHLLDLDADSWMKSWTTQFSISDLDAPVSDRNLECIQYNTRLLSDMISFCLERNLKPVVVLPPVSKALSSKFTGFFRENYIYSYILESVKDRVPFLNYFDDIQFSDSGLYFNAFYLNKKGSLLFTAQLLKDLDLVI